MLPRFDIAIDTLRVHAGPREAAMIAADLRDGGWSVGDNTDWVFIRELAVAAPRHGLRSGASREVRTALQQCVHGGTSAAVNSNAVRFATLPDLLACLLRDLLQGRPRAWFWHKWQHLFRLPRSEAVTQLLWEHLPESNAVFARLQTLRALPLLWQTLTPAHTRILLARLATLLALPPQRLLELPLEEMADTGDCAALASAFRRQRHSLALWQALLSGAAQQPDKLRLAAAMAGLAVMPQAMARRPEQVAGVFNRLVAAVTLQASVAQGTGTASHERGDTAPPGMVMKSTHLPSTVEAQGKVAPKHDDDITAVPLPSVLPAGASGVNDRLKTVPSDGKPPARHRPEKEEGATTEATLPIRAHPTPADSIPLAIQPDLYHTQLGGVFYLIKALDHSDSYALLCGHEEWEQLQSGWTLLYRLALALGAVPDGPLQRFFAQVCGLENVAQLEAIQHPALVASLMPLLRQRYANRLNWDATLLALPARIQATYSNVDVFFDLSAIRLPVRLCGLDLDPGWMPWLGRVVRFHYRDEAALRLRQENPDE